MSKEEEQRLPLLEDKIFPKDSEKENEIKKNDEEMRDSFENYSKLLNKMKKNVDNMGSNKLMNYQNLFNEFDNDMIRLNEEQKKLFELKEILNSEINLPEKVKKNISKVDKDFQNKYNIYQQLKQNVEDYKAKYTKEEKKKYEIIFNEAKENENKNRENENKEEQKIIIKNNEQIFEERKNIIEQAKKTSSQVVDTSKVIKNVINQQGENINDIENNIIESVDNFKKGGDEIKKFQKKTESKISNKKLILSFCLILGLFLLIMLLLRKFK